MIKVAVLDDYQNIFKEIIDIEKLKDRYNFKIFNQAFNDENEAIVALEEFEALFIMRERTPITKTLLENLPASPESIALPDFTPRSFDTNDYAKAKAEIEKQGKATLKIIQDATGLNKVSAKRIMEYFVTAGYVNKKGNIYVLETTFDTKLGKVIERKRFYHSKYGEKKRKCGY